MLNVRLEILLYGCAFTGTLVNQTIVEYPNLLESPIAFPFVQTHPGEFSVVRVSDLVRLASFTEKTIALSLTGVRR